MSEQPGRARLVKRVACALTLAACVATAAFAWFYVLISFQVDWGRDQAIRTATSSAIAALASTAAVPFLWRRFNPRWDYAARVTVTFICLSALVANIMVWGAPDGLIFGLVPTIASRMIWYTPGPLPPFYCTKCRYDLRGLPTPTDTRTHTTICPECGAENRQTARSQDDQSPAAPPTAE